MNDKWKGLLTERRRVVVAGASQPKFAQEGDKLLGGALVDALALSERVQMVEHLKETGRGLVDGADDGSPSSRQRLEQGNALEAGRAVQTTEKNNNTKAICKFGVFLAWKTALSP